MMGVYGMLAAGLAMFAVRYLIPDERWPEPLAKVSFWSLNLGLAWMVFATLFPIGLLQLERSVSIGYFDAREIKYLTTGHLAVHRVDAAAGRRALHRRRHPSAALDLLPGRAPRARPGPLGWNRQRPLHRDHRRRAAAR